MGGFIYEDDTLQFVQHGEGRIIPPSLTYNSIWEYQYKLADHLGNTRVTFTANGIIIPFKATFEDGTNNAIADEEAKYFFNMESRESYPYTATTTDKAQRLNSTTPIGANKSFGVVPGDVIDVSVKAYYTNTSGFGTGATNSGTFANAVSSAFGGANGGGAESEGQFIYDLFTALGTALLTPQGNSDNKPSAYLNYLVFDQDYVLNTAKSGFVGVQTGANTEQNLSATNIEITEAGYIYIYLSYESPSPQYVYFDDFDVTVNESRILSKDDYYPFGLSHSSYAKGGMIGQNFKYNSKELVSDLSLGWYEYQARWYDPALGRWHTVDPAADLMRRHSPYNYVFDNPIRFIDPDGMIPDVFEEQNDGSYKRTKIENGATDTYKHKDGTQQFYNKESGAISERINSDGESVGNTPQNKSPEFSITESYEAFSNTMRGEMFEETVTNVAAAASLIAAGPGLAAEELVIQVASAGGLLNGVDDLSSNFTANGETLITNQLGDQNATLVKTGLSISGAIVGGASSAQAVKDGTIMDAVVNGVGAALDAANAVYNWIVED